MKTVCAVLLSLAAVHYTLQTRCVQLRRIGAILLQPLRAVGETKNGLSAFEAAATSLAATIGTGNIAGVAGAILLGGPGTLFWIWISGALGMALKYAEILSAMRYRIRGKDGQWRGGPMYAVRLGLPLRCAPLGILFAWFGMLAALGMGDLVQVSAAAEAVEMLFLSAGSTVSLPLLNAGTGFVTACVLFAILTGGTKRIGRTAALLVPLMSLVYLLLSGIVILKNSRVLPQVFHDILYGAFRPQAVLGSAYGIGLRECFRTGLSRGIFSHEAGLGTAAIAHSCAESVTPEEQARFGAFEVFFDVFLCTVTGIAILASEIPLPYTNAEINSVLVIDALATCFDRGVSAGILSISLLLFAFTSMTGFALYGSRCAEFLFGMRAVKPYYAVFLAVAIVGPLLPRSRVWETAELVNALLCVPNLITMYLLFRRDAKLQRALQTA